MYKKKGLFLIVCLALSMLSGCLPPPKLTDSQSTIYEKLHKHYTQMQSYEAQVMVTKKSNKTENTYTMSQKVLLPDKGRVTVTEPASMAGTTMIFAGDLIKITNGPKENARIFSTGSETEDTLLHHFFENYYESEETAIQVSRPGEVSKTILLETTALPETANRHKMTLLCDAKTLAPLVLSVYDIGGNVRTITEFLDFFYNPSFDSSEFVIQ